MGNKKKAYGFMDEKDLPKGPFKGQDLVNCDWDITSNHNDIAKNHCGAVLVNNLAIYFENIGYRDLMVNKNKRETFVEIHKIVGNGPVLYLDKKIKLFFSIRGYKIKSERISSFEQIQKAISNKEPLSLLLMSNPLDWHWVMVVGCRKYSSGQEYLRILDGWNNTYNKFYKLNHGSYCILKTGYKIE